MAAQKSYYAIIPASVRYDKELPPNAKLVYGEITALCNQEGYCWASNGYFAQLYDVSETSVSLWIKKLAERKYVRVIVDQMAGNERKIYLNFEKDEPGLFPEVDTSLKNLKEGISENFDTSLKNLKEGSQENLKTSLIKVKHNNTSNNTVNNTEEEEAPASTAVCNSTDEKSYYDVLTEIVELEVIECVDRNYHKTLEFNFSDINKLDKEVTRLFRMFVGGDSDKMNDININRIKRSLIDTRPELTRSICWIIIQRAFADYPTWGKEFKKVGSLLGRIEKQKNKFIEDLNKRIKAADLKEAAIARLEQSKSDKQERDVKIESEVERVGNYAEKYKNILRANEVTEIARLLAEGKPGSAEMVILDAIERKNAREVVE